MTTRNLPIYYRKSNGTYSQVQYTDTTYDLKSLFPVGSIYMAYNNNNSPANFIGGTWAALSTGRVIRAAQASGTGGSDTCTLGTNELPAHTHSVSSSGAHTHSTNSTGAHTHYVQSVAGTYGLIRADRELSTATLWNNDGYFKGRPIVSTSDYANGWAFQASNNGSHSHTIASSGSHTHTTASAGRGKSFSRLPAYINVYCWYRTA